MNWRTASLSVLVLGSAACASSPPSVRGPAAAPPNAPMYSYGGPVSVERYEATPAPLGAPIRAPGGGYQANYGDDPGMQGMAEGNPEQAGLSFERALEVNPFDPAALNNLAVAKAEQGQFHEATALLERASKLQPNNAEIAANLARLRGYVQSYATAGMEAQPQRPQAGPLPPPPPSLWAAGGTGPASYQSSQSVTADYYVSEACKRKTVGSGSKAKVEVECEPRR